MNIKLFEIIIDFGNGYKVEKQYQPEKITLFELNTEFSLARSYLAVKKVTLCQKEWPSGKITVMNTWTAPPSEEDRVEKPLVGSTAIWHESSPSEDTLVLVDSVYKVNDEWRVMISRPDGVLFENGLTKESHTLDEFWAHVIDREMV